MCFLCTLASLVCVLCVCLAVSTFASLVCCVRMPTRIHTRFARVCRMPISAPIFAYSLKRKDVRGPISVTVACVVGMVLSMVDERYFPNSPFELKAGAVIGTTIMVMDMGSSEKFYLKIFFRLVGTVLGIALGLCFGALEMRVRSPLSDPKHPGADDWNLVIFRIALLVPTVFLAGLLGKIRPVYAYPLVTFAVQVPQGMFAHSFKNALGVALSSMCAVLVAVFSILIFENLNSDSILMRTNWNAIDGVLQVMEIALTSGHTHTSEASGDTKHIHASEASVDTGGYTLGQTTGQTGELVAVLRHGVSGVEAMLHSAKRTSEDGAVNTRESQHSRFARVSESVHRSIISSESSMKTSREWRELWNLRVERDFSKIVIKPLFYLSYSLFSCMGASECLWCDNAQVYTQYYAEHVEDIPIAISGIRHVLAKFFSKRFHQPVHLEGFFNTIIESCFNNGLYSILENLSKTYFANRQVTHKNFSQRWNMSNFLRQFALINLALVEYLQSLLLLVETSEWDKADIKLKLERLSDAFDVLRNAEDKGTLVSPETSPRPLVVQYTPTDAFGFTN